MILASKERKINPPADKPKLIVILGPTASGKTALAVKLAKKFNAEIISADSRQIYRRMDIGTAKPRPDPKFKRQNSKLKSVIQQPVIVEGIPHWLIDIRNPDENYTVAEFKDDAAQIVNDTSGRGKVAMMCGGTGLYIEVVVKNLEIPRVPPNPALRKRLEKELKERGIGFLFKKLVRLDPEAAYIIDPRNARRIIRALEVILATQKPFTQQRRIGKPLFDVLQIGIKMGKDKLRQRIDVRIDAMMKAGLVMEVKKLIRIYPKKTIAFDAIGYREIIGYLDGKISRDEAIELMKKNTWRFARRQMSWFRRDPSIQWVNNKHEAHQLIKRFLRE